MSKLKKIILKIREILKAAQPLIIIALAAATAFGMIDPNTATAIRNATLGL